ITARELLNNGKQEEAIQLIEKTKDTELKQMLQLFDDIKIAYKESLRETILVLGNDNEYMGIAVDKIISIENLFEFDENFIKESLTNTEYLSGVAKNKNDNVILLLNDEYILSKYH
ncbi:MAG: chemotaxis protein CheW, partial [Candidatus Gastranaerophilales bacterium]|nr:chemotaxis protein CheW [Candidatus Gastranaerophilales bacterium]